MIKGSDADRTGDKLIRPVKLLRLNIKVTHWFNRSVSLSTISSVLLNNTCSVLSSTTRAVLRITTNWVVLSEYHPISHTEYYWLGTTQPILSTKPISSVLLDITDRVLPVQYYQVSSTSLVLLILFTEDNELSTTDWVLPNQSNNTFVHLGKFCLTELSVLVYVGERV